MSVSIVTLVLKNIENATKALKKSIDKDVTTSTTNAATAADLTASAQKMTEQVTCFDTMLSRHVLFTFAD